jgi:bifunctional non-homologous end joining protein LigD
MEQIINELNNYLLSENILEEAKSKIFVRPFVLQEHKSPKHNGPDGIHLDFRLAYLRYNTLASWAIPKAKVPTNKKEKYLAIRTRDHEKIWLNVQGPIDEGEYGAGYVKILQKGFAEIINWGKESITFKIEGNPLNGKFHLIRLKSKKHYTQEVWLFLRSGEIDD